MVINTKIGVKIVLKTKKDIETMQNILGKKIYAEFFLNTADDKLEYYSKFINYDNEVNEDGKMLIKRIFKDFQTINDSLYNKIEKSEFCLSLSRDGNRIIRGIIQ